MIGRPRLAQCSLLILKLWVAATALEASGSARAASDLAEDTSLTAAPPPDITSPAQPGLRTSWGLVERNFWDVQAGVGAPGRQALTTSLFVNLAADVAVSQASFDVRGTPVVGIAIQRHGDVGNFTMNHRDGTTSNEPVWGGLATWEIEFATGPATITAGLRELDNPFLDSRANRSLPPAFHGVTGSVTLTPGTVFSAGVVDSVRPRGGLDRIPLVTTYGRSPIPAVLFAGVSGLEYAGWSADLFGSHSRDLWNQWFGSVRHDVHDGILIGTSWSAAAYWTDHIAVPAQGLGRNLAWSMAVSRQTGWQPLSLGLAYQQIEGDQFYDYVDETWGIRLANALSVDYNAPHEKSLQLNATLAEVTARGTRVRLTTWKAFGWGANGAPAASTFATPGSAAADLYVAGGQPIHGSHQDAGLNLAVDFAPGATLLSGSTVKVIALTHHSPSTYAQASFHELRLIWDLTFH